MQANQYQESTKYYYEATKIASQLGSKPKEINASIGLGNAFKYMGDFDSSEKYLLNAVILAELSDDKSLEKEAHSNLGHTYYNNNRFTAAVKSYLKVQEISHDLREEKDEANVWLMLGNTFQKMQQNEQAITSYQKALDISKKLNDKKVQENAVHAIGCIHFDNGKYEEALEYLKMSVKIADKSENRRKERALSQKRLGMCYTHLERFAEGLTSFKEALKTVRECSEAVKKFKRSLHEWSGYCCRFLPGQQEEAIAFYVKSLEISILIGDKYQQHCTNYTIGNVFCKIGSYQKAKEYYQTANEIATEIGEKHGEGTGCLDLATVYSKECDYETAVEWYEKALGIFEVEANNDLLKEKALTGLGIAQFNLGNIKKATELFQSVRELANEGSSKGNYFHIKIKRKLYLFFRITSCYRFKLSIYKWFMNKNIIFSIA